MTVLAASNVSNAPIYAAVVTAALALFAQLYLNTSKLRNTEAERKLTSARQFLRALEQHKSAHHMQYELLKVFESKINAARIEVDPSKPSPGMDFYWENNVVVEAENRIYAHRAAVYEALGALQQSLLDIELHFSPRAWEYAEDLVLLANALNSSPESAERAEEALENVRERAEGLHAAFTQRVMTEVKHQRRVFRLPLRGAEPTRAATLKRRSGR